MAFLAAGLGLPSQARAAEPVKVAVIVGPVGSLTPTYLQLAEAAAATAERHGATVARAYSPNATPANVLAAVADANVIVYFGHGYGHPSPYGGLDTSRQNGWGLQGPRARGTHADGIGGELAYYGEDWIVANARPAPGFVMIYSNTCYAPGASEGGFAPATPWVAAERVAYYSRKVFTMGGSAYFATDFDRGAADLVDRLLANPRAGYGAIFASDRRFVPGALTTQPHLFSAGQQIWLHRTKYTDGPPNYWYAFAGNPDATPIRSWDPIAPTLSVERPSGTADVDPWAEPKLRFSEPVAGVDASTVRLLGPDGDPVAIEVVHNRATGALRIVPRDDLELSARYTVEVGAGITDVAGNRLASASWTFTTRLDADALGEPLPVVLAAGAHRLVRLAADGSVAEEREVTLDAERTLSAASRARLPDLGGSWLELDGRSLTGWWVQESARAHAPGLAEEVLVPRTEVRLAVPADPGAASLDGIADDSTSERVVVVDRRAVIDGRTHLRVVAGVLERGALWVEAPADALPAGLSEDRVLERGATPTPSELRLGPGDHVAFRFDAVGRVVERRTVSGGEARHVVDGLLSVAGRRFHVVATGELAGWAFADGPRITLTAIEAQDPS